MSGNCWQNNLTASMRLSGKSKHAPPIIFIISANVYYAVLFFLLGSPTMRHVNVIWSRLYALGAIISLTVLVAGCGVPEKSASLDATVMAESAGSELTDADEKPTGETLTCRYLPVDTHIDVPYRFQNIPNQDVSESKMRVWREVEAYPARSEQFS